MVAALTAFEQNVVLYNTVVGGKTFMCNISSCVLPKYLLSDALDAVS